MESKAVFFWWLSFISGTLLLLTARVTCSNCVRFAGGVLGMANSYFWELRNPIISHKYKTHLEKKRLPIISLGCQFLWAVHKRSQKIVSFSCQGGLDLQIYLNSMVPGDSEGVLIRWTLGVYIIIYIKYICKFIYLCYIIISWYLFTCVLQTLAISWRM